MASGNKILIAFLSVSTENSTGQLFEQIKRENDDLRCVFVKLTQQDLQSFQPGETYDAVVLLHSISQGRNSITDVAGAKYSKLLPELKRIYGSDRVAVVVHSMTSFNSHIKRALMMVFKKSQPTTFQCSKCVIQCNNLAEMLAQELSRLTEFLGKVPDHPLPIPEDEAHSPLTTTPSADKIDRIGNGNKSRSTPVSGSVTRAVAPTQPTNNQTLIKSTSSAYMEDGYPPYMASDISQLSARFSDTLQVSQASSRVDTSPGRYAPQYKMIDTTYPIALVNLSSSNQLEKLKDDLQRQLPGKLIMLIKDKDDLIRSCHLFEAIFVDLGAWHRDISDKERKMVPGNIALLMLATANPSAKKRASAHSRFLDEVPVFQYSSDSCRQSLFDDKTKDRLFSWLLDSCKRFPTFQKGLGLVRLVNHFLIDFLKCS